MRPPPPVLVLVLVLVRVHVLAAVPGPGASTGPIEVAGPPCPAPEQVSERLAALLPQGAAESGRRVRIERVEPPTAQGVRSALLRIELLDRAGMTQTVRFLDASASCSDLAAAAAVVIATAWQAGPGAAPEGEPGPIQIRPRPPPPPPPLPGEVSAGFLALFAGAQAAPGAMLSTSIAPRGRRLGARLSFFGTAPRDLPVGPGRASYTRIAWTCGPRYRLSRGRLFTDIYAEGLLALVLVQGAGFPENYRSTNVDLGLGLGVRAALRAGPVAPYLGLGIAGWLRPQVVSVTGYSDTATLPQFEVLLSTGVALGTFP